MNQIARCDWLPEREPSCPLGTTRCIPQAKFHQKPYNKSFIDQVCSVKMAGYWPRSFFASLWTLDFVSVHNHAKKELGQYPTILTLHLVNNPYVMPTARLWVSKNQAKKTIYLINYLLTSNMWSLWEYFKPEA